MTTQLVPKRRFKRFNERWKKRQLKEVAEVISGGTPSTTNASYWDGPIDWYTPTEIESNIYMDGSQRKITASGLNNSSAKLLPPFRTVLFTSRAGIGNMAILAKEGSTNQGFQSFVLKDNMDTYFLYSMGHKIKEYALRNASGSTFLEVSRPTLENAPLYIPQVAEQQKIGEFFKLLDGRITNQKRKIEKIKALKQAYLTEMFPQEDENVPKRRFKGFNEIWKKYQLKEVAEVISGGTPSTTNASYWDGSIDWYTPTEIESNIYMKGSQRKITASGLKNSSAKLLPSHRTILFTSRAGIGNMAILVKEGSTNQGFQSFVLKDNKDTYFLYSMGHQIKEYALRNASGSTFLEVSRPILEKAPLYIPQLAEQQKIGEFFKTLDEKIEAEEKKLEKLKKMKAAFLEEMFV